MKTRTFTIIKPDAVAAGYTGKILDTILSNGFTVRAMKMTFLSRNDAARFYAVHRNKPFFEELLEYMTSGAIVVAILEGEDAVDSFRRLVGATDPRNAEEGTIRRMFGTDLTRNAIHASDSVENAEKEWRQFFDEKDIIEIEYSPEMLVSPVLIEDFL